MKHIELTEMQIKSAYEKIKRGDRSDLLTGKLFNLKHFTTLSETELMEIRKHIKHAITTLSIQNELAEMSEAKDISLKLALYDELKYEIKEFMTATKEICQEL